MHTFLKWLATASVLCTLLSACGQTGPLYLPPPPQAPTQAPADSQPPSSQD